ncbi:MAG: hypothetical protein ACC652_01760 [Acidimicrobiales bacterium]
MQFFSPPARFTTPVRCVTDVARLTCGLSETASEYEVAAVHLGHREALLSVVIYDDHEPRPRPDRWQILQQAVASSAVSFWLVGLRDGSVLVSSAHRQWCSHLQREAEGTRFEGWLQLGSDRSSLAGLSGLVDE